MTYRNFSRYLFPNPDKMKLQAKIICCAVLIFSFYLLNGQPADSVNNGLFEIKATFVDEPPRIDGKLDDDVWKAIPAVSNFIQLWPEEGAKATEDSEVRIAYDRDFLYFGFRFYDQNPELIRAMNLERGGRNDRDDHAYIGLDTYLDRRNAYLFEMNSLGTQDDATITDERLTLDGFSWDAVFKSETMIDEQGWTLEVSIPFRQLRFPKGEELEFGLMLSRMINRKNERVIWPKIGLEYGTFAAGFSALAASSQYGILSGLKNVRRGHNIEIKPYITLGASRLRKDLQFEKTENEFDTDFGMDLKYGISSNLTLDLTVNTDFAQVEADNVQVNLTRFNLFFPEKREFFLERSGLFEHGNSRSTQTFFSRRIGLTNQILAGARLTGQLGPLSIGLLNIETGDKIKHIFGDQSANNLVARIRTSIFPRATVGAIFTNLQEKDAFNRAIGFDTRYRFWGSSEFNAWYTHVADTDPTQSDNAGHISLNLQNDRYGAEVSYTSVGENYNPALGFVRRRNMRRYNGELTYRGLFDSEEAKLKRITNILEYDFIEGQNGVKQSTDFEAQIIGEFEKRDQIGIEYNHRFENLIVPFNIRDNVQIPAGDYNFSTIEISGSTDQSRRLSGGAGISAGNFFHGKRTSLEGSIGFRQSKHLTLEGTIDYSKINLPEANGKFDATTISTSILGALNKNLFAKALIQYDNFTRDLQANIRVDWIHTPGSDLFLVYNTSYHFTGENEDIFDPHRNMVLKDQVGIIKLTYLILL